MNDLIKARIERGQDNINIKPVDLLKHLVKARWVAEEMEKVMNRLIRFLERHGILLVDEPWVPPTHKYWYYYCWYPPIKGLKGGYGFELN